MTLTVLGAGGAERRILSKALSKSSGIFAEILIFINQQY
jgi:hypothetical protein